MPTLDINTYGLPVETGYGFTERPAFTGKKPLWGRARYRFRDTVPSIQMAVTYVWPDDTFRRFKAFWDNDLFYGSLYFTAPLMLANYDPLSGDHIRNYLVHATDPYRAVHKDFGNWEVTLSLEVAYQSIFIDCDEIFGGPISALAPTDIYGGPITSLAPDTIAPCPTVDPHA